jgi:hypothetical protein
LRPGHCGPWKVFTAVIFHRIGAAKDELEEIFRIVGQLENGPSPVTKEDHAIKDGIGRIGFEIDRIAPDAHSDLAQTSFLVVGKVVLATVIEEYRMTDGRMVGIENVLWDMTFLRANSSP